MAEEFEGYSDTFEVVGNPYGLLINFNLSPPNMKSDPTTVARMRVSWEMGKVLTTLLLRHIKTAEEKAGVSYPMSYEVLNSLRIAREDWDGLWASPKLNIGDS